MTTFFFFYGLGAVLALFWVLIWLFIPGLIRGIAEIVQAVWQSAPGWVEAFKAGWRGSLKEGDGPRDGDRA